MFRWFTLVAALSWATAALAGSPTTAATDSANPPQTGSNEFVVTLLGTGSPVPSDKRFGMSTLVRAGDQTLLFDAGRGTFIRLWQLGLSRGNIDAIFLTHLHSDHTVGLPDLLMTGWVMDTFNTKAGAQPLTVYGPGSIEGRIGTTETLERLKTAYEADNYIRRHDEKLPTKGLKIQGHDIHPGVVFNHDGVKVTAFSVDHGEWAKPAFGYRIDYDGRSVLLSGDTRYSPDEPLLENARGVDVLIHEVADARQPILDSHMGQAIMNHHTLPQQAGQVFAEIQPRLAVYSHIVRLSNAEVAAPPMSDLIDKTRQSYDGPLLVGQDLTSIVIGPDQVRVEQPKLGLRPVAP